MDEQRGLGRRFAPDERDRKYPLRALVTTVERKDTAWPMFARPLDQGRTGTCVGHAWKHFLMMAPVIQSRAHQTPSAIDIYRRAILIDEWAENDRDEAMQFGTSVRAGAKALQEQGFIGGYSWAFDIDTAIDWLCVGGPLVMGTNWYSSFEPKDGRDYIRIAPGAWVRGGHAYTLNRWSERRGAARAPNSWGGWGSMWIAGEDLERLLREDGDACTATELRRPR